MQFVRNGFNSIAVVVVVIAIGYYGLVNIQIRPLWMLVRGMLLAGLGEPTQGLTVEGKPDKLTCEPTTQKCRWE